MREWYQKYKYRLDVGLLLSFTLIFVLFLCFLLKEFYLWSFKKENAEREIQAIYERGKKEISQLDQILQAKKEGFEAEINSLIKRRQELSQDNKDLSQKKHAIDKQISQREAQLATTDEQKKKFDLLILLIKDRTNELSALKQQLQSLQGQLQKTEINYKDAVQKTQEQRNSFGKFAADIENSKKQFQLLNAKILDKNTQLTQLDEMIAKKNHEFQLIQKKVEQLEGTQKPLSETLAKIQTDCLHTKSLLAGLQEKLKETETSKTSLNTKISVLKNEKGKLENAILILNKENDGLVRHQDSLKKNIGILQQEQASIEKKIKDLHSASNQQDIAYATARQKNQTEQDNLKNLLNEKQQILQQISKYKKENAVLSEEYNYLSDTVDKSKKELTSIKQNHSELSAEILKLKEQKAELNGQIKALEQRKNN